MVGKTNKIKKVHQSQTFDSVKYERIDVDSEGQRIDNFLLKRFQGVPKSHIYQILRSGQVRVNSKRINSRYRLQLEDEVRLPPIKKEARRSTSDLQIRKSQLKIFNIIFQDDALLVLDKPPGMAVHGGSGISFGVIEQVRAQYPDWKFVELVHRLDRETSGVLLLAKRRQALVELHRQIREGQTEKRYLTLVKGQWNNAKQSVKLPLSKYVTSAGERRVAVVTSQHKMQNAMTAHTIFRLQKSWTNFSLLEAELITGRTHQIRVHLAHLGFPIVGDDKYGDFALNKQLTSERFYAKMPRMFLHAHQMVFKHPKTGMTMKLESPLTDDLHQFIAHLDAQEQPKI